MRPQVDLRARRACAAVAALGLTYVAGTHSPLIAGAETGIAQGATSLGAQIDGSHELRYGQRVAVSGTLPDSRAGVPLALEYQPAANAPWAVVASAVSGRGGAYRVKAPMTRSGELRIAETGLASTATANGSMAPALGAPPASAPLPIGVKAGFGVRRRALDVLGGQRATVAGTIQPAVAGRVVALQVRAGRGWRTVARAHTGARGRFRLSYTPQGTGSQPVRLSFPGDAANAASTRRIGHLNVYQLAGASWYDLSGTTACGQSLGAGTMGVANKTLPCGTMVTLRYGGNTVRVPVIDRGPYVAGRQFDLTAATKAALGFGDTGYVWATAV